MKRIGILTFHFAHNYGGQLQAYALKSFLTDQGKDVSFIGFAPQKMLDSYSLNPFKNIKSYKSIIKKMLVYSKRKKQYDKFESFIEQQLGFNKNKEWSPETNYYDVVITGSDQVWNGDITGNYSEYYLSFVQNAKKISYAASFGKSEVSEETLRLITKYLPKFEAVSVREKSGCEVVKKAANIDVVQVCDPVFLLPKEYWTSLVTDINVLKEDFILYYSLENNKELYHRTVELSKKLNIPIYGIHPLCQKQGEEINLLQDIGPLEFIWLINNAKIVCSNSFHAVAFSVILNKKLLHLPHKTLGGRSVELLQTLGITKEDLDQVVDIEKFDYSKLKEVIRHSKMFLKDNCG